MNHEFGDVVEHLSHHAGETLRTVLVYDDDGHRDLYRREDVADRHDTDLEAAVVDAARSDRLDDPAVVEHDGPHRATVRVFDTRVIVHLPRNDRSGAVVVLDTAAARDLTEFVRDVRADLYGE